MNIKEFMTRDDCAHALATEIADALSATIGQNGFASLALSGGNSPKKVLPMLASAPLQWPEVLVTLSDERCVLPTDKESNAGMVQTYFIEKGAKDVRFFPLWAQNEDIDAGLKSTERSLSEFTWPLDVIYLGMGEDGHFASLFPCDDVANFKNQQHRVVAGHAPSPPHDRVSLSLSTILQARHLFLHVTGSAKRKTFEDARTIDPTPGCPISILVHNKEIDLQVYLVD